MVENGILPLHSFCDQHEQCGISRLKSYIVHLIPFFEYIVVSFSPGVYSVILHSIRMRRPIILVPRSYTDNTEHVDCVVARI